MSDRTLPLEAINDLEKMRETLELVITQSKEIGKDKAKTRTRWPAGRGDKLTQRASPATTTTPATLAGRGRRHPRRNGQLAKRRPQRRVGRGAIQQPVGNCARQDTVGDEQAPVQQPDNPLSQTLHLRIGPTQVTNRRPIRPLNRPSASSRPISRPPTCRIPIRSGAVALYQTSRLPGTGNSAADESTCNQPASQSTADKAGPDTDAARR